MSEQLNRKDIDDLGRRNNQKDSYKNRIFDGKRTTVDEYSGDTLYYSNKGIHSDSGKRRHFTTNKTANVDHIVPIDQMIDKYGKSVSKEQLKRITNSDYNLAITSEARNKSKKAQSNHEYLYKQLKEGKPENLTTTYNMLQKEIASNVAIRADVTTTRVTEAIGNVSKIDKKTLKSRIDKTAGTVGNAMYTGTSAALMSLTVSSINNIVFIAIGEKKINEAIKDIAQDTSGSFVSGVGVDLAQRTVADVAKYCGTSNVAQILSKDLPIAEISAMIMVGNSVRKFIDDDISAEECVTEIVMNGVGVLAYQLGMVAGGPAGAIIASLVVGQISKTVLEYKQVKKINSQKQNQINTIVRDALVTMESQRKNLKQMIQLEYQQWDEAFDEGFKLIFSGNMENDAEEIAIGLDSILAVFNGKCRFKTLEEFNIFFENTEAILTL